MQIRPVDIVVKSAGAPSEMSTGTEISADFSALLDMSTTAHIAQNNGQISGEASPDAAGMLFAKWASGSDELIRSITSEADSTLLHEGEIEVANEIALTDQSGPHTSLSASKLVAAPLAGQATGAMIDPRQDQSTGAPSPKPSDTEPSTQPEMAFTSDGAPPTPLAYGSNFMSVAYKNTGHEQIKAQADLPANAKTSPLIGTSSNTSAAATTAFQMAGMVSAGGANIAQYSRNQADVDPTRGMNATPQLQDPDASTTAPLRAVPNTAQALMAMHSQLAGAAKQQLEPAGTDGHAQALISPSGTVERIAQTPITATIAASGTDATLAQIRGQMANVSIGQGGKSAELRLDPPELGRVRISLEIVDNHVTAHLSPDRPEVMDLLRRHADLLMRDLLASGFDGAQMSFSEGQAPEKMPENTANSSQIAPEPTVITLPLSGDRLDMRL